MKKWGIIIVTVVVFAALYFIEFSKIETGNGSSNSIPTLDNLKFDETAQNWEDFYKVRATIIDGQTAEFEIPKKLKEKIGSEMKLNGAAVFFSPGCKFIGDKIAVHSLFLYPTLGLANACIHLPEVAMRWTIQINLADDWIISQTDMIDAVVNVSGTFRIDTSKPYEAAFFLDNANIKFAQEKEVKF
ncbi:hypothetical protein OU798_09605 [Prolixibacteraceae bacterium Z1-6]|uniref:Uncharacterized protein n=1 Tax=Draconibacterium aestuarii TaxID=2998507 RepID=A0A9X3J650_9BACT|nr:hypothetical protein [Prolixibacteraceae bacterium Z1-6]